MGGAWKQIWEQLCTGQCEPSGQMPRGKKSQGSGDSKVGCVHLKLMLSSIKGLEVITKQSGQIFISSIKEVH